MGSSLMGMISGTAVANVLTTGTISIPLLCAGVDTDPLLLVR